MKYHITILVDDPEAWIIPWAEALVEKLRSYHTVSLVHSTEDIQPGDFCFLLGCQRKLSSQSLLKNRYNIVVHESDLPEGRGFSPVAWQILEGRNQIPVCLMLAVEEVDAGPVFLRDTIDLDGTELLPEIRQKQGLKTMELCLRFFEAWPDIEAFQQKGAPSFYRRRNRNDDRIDPYKSIAEQFDHLRIVDNDRYSAWFEIRGQRYSLKVTPYNETSKDAE